MSNQVKSVKYMTDYAKKNIEDINTNVADAQVKSMKNVIDKNYDDLKDISSKSAEINKEAISMTTKAIKDKNSFTPTTYASNYDTYIKVVALAFAEGGGKTEKNSVKNVSNVVSSVLNRVDDGRFGGKDVISVISAKNQYAGYNNNNYNQKGRNSNVRYFRSRRR